jgi:hypothetical protein
MFLNGCEDSVTIRTCFEFARWAKLTLQDSCFLSASFEKVEDMLVKRCDGDLQVDSRRTLRLPTADGNNLLSYSSGGWDGIPAKLKNCSVAEETAAVEVIIGKIRDKMAVDLDLSPIVNRWPEIVEDNYDATNGAPCRRYLRSQLASHEG